MAYYHGDMVYGLYFLSHISLQADVKVLKVFQRTFWRGYWKADACVSVFLCGVVCHRNLAWGQLEFCGMGAGKLDRDYDFPGICAVISEISPESQWYDKQAKGRNFRQDVCSGKQQFLSAVSDPSDDFSHELSAFL